MTHITKKQMGDAGEMLVAAELTLHGIPSFIVPSNWPRYDVVAQHPALGLQRISIKTRTFARGPVAELVGIEGGVVSGVFNLESSGVEAPDRRPRHEEHYHDARCSNAGGTASPCLLLRATPRPQAGSAPCLGAWGARRPN